MLNAIVRVENALVEGVTVKKSLRGAYAGQEYAVVTFTDETGNRSQAIDRDSSRVRAWTRGVYDLRLHVREGHSAQRNDSWTNVDVVDAALVNAVGAPVPAPQPVAQSAPAGVDMAALAAAVAQVMAQQQGGDA